MGRHFFPILIAVALVLAPGKASSASDAVAVVNKLIAQGELTKAREKIDAYLERDPDDVDALMMLGNVILNEYFQSQQVGVNIRANEDESIFDRTIGFVREPVYTVPLEVAEKVKKLWKRCLVLDNTREDIHKGLCYLFGVSLMKDELLSHLPIMKAALTGEKELYFTMSDYALLFKERGRFQDCMRIYEAIIGLYPEQSGLYGDVAQLYFRNGRQGLGKKYLEIALAKKNIDEVTYANAVLIFTITGEHEKAKEAFRKLSRLRGDGEWLLYDSLFRLLRGEKQWKEPLAEFIRGADQGNLDLSLAKLLLSAGADDFESYRKSLEYADKAYFRILIEKRAMEKFADRFEPAFGYAEMMIGFKNYDEAIKTLKRIRSRGLDRSKDQDEVVTFYNAWAFQDSGKIREADFLWKNLLASGDFYFLSSAAYFLGKNSLTRGDEERAAGYFAMVAGRASDSKYATMAWNRLRELKEE